MSPLEPVGTVRSAGTLRRTGHLLAALLLATAVVLATTLLGTRPAAAASADQIDSFDIAYVMQPSGVLHVTETIDWRFGDSSKRHGIQRDLVTREKYDDQHDAVYGIDHVTVTSPDDVSTAVSQSTTPDQDGRFETLNLKIGSASQTIDTPSATYVIAYDVTGAMRTFPGKNPPYDEFFWDGPGFGNPAITNLSMTVKVPEGPYQDGISCFAGPAGATAGCQKKQISGQTATFSQDDLPANQSVSVGVKVRPGLVTDNQPHLEPDASALSPGEKLRAVGVAVVSGLSLVLAPILGVVYWRRKGRDQRYGGLAPGTTPLPGQPVSVVPNDPDIPIPVAFSPPKIPVAEAGLLADGQVDTRETAATIIDLAVRGVLTVQSEHDEDFRVTLVDPGKASAPHEMVLLTALFAGAPPGAVKDLSEQGSMLDAHQAMQEAVRNQVSARGWFTKVPTGRATKGLGFTLIAAVVFSSFVLGAWAILLAVPLVPIVLTAAIVRAKLKRGQRTPDGRAVCDQVEGFRTYLATAEADQLRFEEGEDIFSRYLPWAIVFELADRWADLCADLVRMGRLPDTTPYWYYGSYHLGAFNTGFLTGSLTSAATPAPTSSGSGGTGFGGGSSFGGGGFSGGGGGGGGSSSW